MTYAQDLSPSKLVLVEVIRRSYGPNPADRSDSAQDVWKQLSEDDLEQMKRMELEYLAKLDTGWEPTKRDAYAMFFRNASTQMFMSTILTEWEETIRDASCFIPWMVCVCKWRAEQVEEEEETPFSPLFTFVASAVASFHMVPFSQHRSLASTLVRYIHESISLSIDLGASFPPFSPTFTSVQYGSWMRSFQDCLVQQLGSYDPDDLFDRLQSVSPPPYPLLASLRFIQGDVPSAHSLLLKGVTSSLSMESVLLPLAHYSIGNEERAQRFVRELEHYYHMKPSREVQLACSFFHMLYSSNVKEMKWEAEECLRLTDDASSLTPTFLKLIFFHPSLLDVSKESQFHQVIVDAGTIPLVEGWSSVEEGIQWVDQNWGEGIRYDPIPSHYRFIHQAMQSLREMSASSFLQNVELAQNHLSSYTICEEVVWQNVLCDLLIAVFECNRGRIDTAMKTIQHAQERLGRDLSCCLAACTIVQGWCLSMHSPLPAVLAHEIWNAMKLCARMRLVSWVLYCLYLLAFDGNKKGLLERISRIAERIGAIDLRNRIVKEMQ